MVDAVRAAGGSQPVSLGDGAWGIEISGQDTGFSIADSARLCDFIGPHVYPVGTDQVRQHYAAAWACELATTFGRPVILEEFGVSSDFASDENAAHYYRQALHNSLLAGATGWLGLVQFRLRRPDPPGSLPASRLRAAFRPHRLTRPAQAAAGRDEGVRRRADRGRRRQCERADSETALIVSAYLDTSYPFTSPGDRRYLARALHQAYVSARLADLAPAITRESAA